MFGLLVVTQVVLYIYHVAETNIRHETIISFTTLLEVKWNPCRFDVDLMWGCRRGMAENFEIFFGLFAITSPTVLNDVAAVGRRISMSHRIQKKQVITKPFFGFWNGATPQKRHHHGSER